MNYLIDETVKYRQEIVLKSKKMGVGVELGVAEGVMSERIMNLRHLSFLYSIDMYAGDRGHNDEQYKRALKRLQPHKERNSIIRLKFDIALNLFPDNYFDFIYIDGYAHTGEEDGQTLHQWYPKLKSGGVFSGDDYHHDWPKVIHEVNNFVSINKLKLHLVECSEELQYCKYPTWYTIKP